MNLFLKIAFSLIVAFAFSVGRSFDLTDMLVVSFGSLYLPFAFQSVVTFGLLSAIDIGNRKWNEMPRKKLRKNMDNKFFLAKIKPFIPLFFWLISLLSTFPGISSYDSKEEWEMMRDGVITSHHPVIHVVILGGLQKVSNDWFGTGNPGIFVYVVLQLAMYVFVIKQLFDLFKKNNVSELKQWVAVLFFSLSPIIQLFSILTSKDSIFSVFELWLLVCLANSYFEEDILCKRKAIVHFIIASFGTSVFRKNGIYIVVVVMLVYALRNRKSIKKLLPVYAIIFGLYMLYVGPCYKLLNVQAGSVREMLSVPIQQLARVHRFDIDSFEDEDLEILYRIIPKEGWESYRPTVSDPVKAWFVDEEFDILKVDFLRTWIKQGVKHPKLYVDSVLVNTVDLWYPLARNDGYRGLYGLDTSKSNFFDYWVDEPGRQIVFFDLLHRYYKYISEDLNVGTRLYTSIFLNPGWYILTWMGILFHDISRKKKCRIEYHCAMAMTLLTVLMGPISAIRYVYIFYLALPMGFLED